MHLSQAFLMIAVFFGVCHPLQSQVSDRHDLIFRDLAASWDEGIPLGNGLIGALVWKKDGALRMSLDRADLWDLRSVKEFERAEFRFAWVEQQVRNKDYKPVQELFDLPYDRDPAPTKIPAGALEFDVKRLGDVTRVRLSLRRALCTVEWKSGATLTTFVHATEPLGWFRLEHLQSPILPRLLPPRYAGIDSSRPGKADVVTGDDLRRLGYPPPDTFTGENSARFHQRGWSGFGYEVNVTWQQVDSATLEGSWSITLDPVPGPAGEVSAGIPVDAPARRIDIDRRTHEIWWRTYWEKSSIRLPDSVLERQWYREIYKFGAASRRGAPPITLQAVWTADNGSIPPWKGDFHNDLNTQLSYWPCYSANHLEEGSAFLDWLWQCKSEAERYTKTFFERPGLNFPGVSTLTGRPMGGWIQYALSPTVSAWLSHHFYLQWRYTMDRDFLVTRAYPWLHDVALFLQSLSRRETDGKRTLPLSSSPEINDNGIDAWFSRTTNFDLALIRWLYSAAAEMADSLGRKEEGAQWRRNLSEWPDLARAEGDGKLLVAPGVPLAASHRHFSHLMAIHPLGIVDWEKGAADRRTIRASLADLKRLGTDQWCGYSYAWLSSLAARGRDGEAAAEALRSFADCFCLPNSFHVNGDQSGTGKSTFTYRPFTLEGNFAFAAGVQEMLLQSHAGAIRVFPAVPKGWKVVSFTNLRAEGAFLVSASMVDGRVHEVRIVSEKGGRVRIAKPFDGRKWQRVGKSGGLISESRGLLEFETDAGTEVVLTPVQ